MRYIYFLIPFFCTSSFLYGMASSAPASPESSPRVFRSSSLKEFLEKKQRCGQPQEQSLARYAHFLTSQAAYLKSRDYQSILDNAVISGNVDPKIVDHILSLPALYYAPDPAWPIPLDEEVPKHCLRLNRIIPSTGKTLLATAAMHGDVAMCAKLLEKGANIEQRDGEDNTALWHAVRTQKEQAVRLLLEKGACPNTMKCAMSVLAFALMSPNPSYGIIKCLLEKSAWPLVLAPNGQWLTMATMQARSAAIVRLLDKHGIDVEIEGDKLPL